MQFKLVVEDHVLGLELLLDRRVPDRRDELDVLVVQHDGIVFGEGVDERDAPPSPL